MLAVYKKELKSYFTSVIGWVFIAFFLILVGLYFMVYNLMNGYTDFTPVFRLVDQLMEDGEFRHLKGLLYFTDGGGIYPDVEPVNETAFVFINQKLKKGKTPDWAYDLNLGLETESV